jgi:hypothetical protein
VAPSSKPCVLRLPCSRCVRRCGRCTDTTKVRARFNGLKTMGGADLNFTDRQKSRVQIRSSGAQFLMSVRFKRLENSISCLFSIRLDIPTPPPPPFFRLVWQQRKNGRLPRSTQVLSWRNPGRRSLWLPFRAARRGLRECEPAAQQPPLSDKRPATARPIGWLVFRFLSDDVDVYGGGFA